MEEKDKVEVLVDALYGDASYSFADRRLGIAQQLVREGLLRPGRRGASPFHDKFTITPAGKKYVKGKIGRKI